MKKFFAVFFAIICTPFLLFATLGLIGEVIIDGQIDSERLVFFFALLLFAALPCIILWSAFRKPTLETTKWNPTLPTWTMVLVVLLIGLGLVLSVLPFLMTPCCNF